MPQSTPILFNPPAEITSALLLALTDPALSFNQLAQVCGTTPEALALWLQRPDIRAQIESVDRITTWRTRLIAANHLHAVPPALIKILHNFLAASDAEDAAALTPYSETPPTTSPTEPALASALDYREKLLALRHAETARKSAALLITLARSRPTPGPEHAAAAPLANSTNATSSVSPSVQGPESPIAAPQPQPPTQLSLEDLLAQLAPHLTTLAADLGIDPNEPLPQTPVEPAQPHATSHPREPIEHNYTSNDHTTKPPAPRAPSRRGEEHNESGIRNQRSPELATATAHEHWP